MRMLLSTALHIVDRQCGDADRGERFPFRHLSGGIKEAVITMRFRLRGC
jgi:hypothetical protein